MARRRQQCYERIKLHGFNDCTCHSNVVLLRNIMEFCFEEKITKHTRNQSKELHVSKSEES